MATPRNPIRDPRFGLLDNAGMTASAAAAGRDTAVDLSGLVAGLSAIGQTAADQVAEQRRQEEIAERLRVAKADAKLRAELTKAMDGADPSAETFVQDMQARFDAIVKDVMAGAGFAKPETAELFGVEAEGLVATMLSRANQMRTGFLEKQAQDLWAQHTDVLFNAVMTSPEDPTGVLKSHAAQTERLLGALPAEMREKARQKLEEGVILAAAEGRARKGQYAAARALLDPKNSPGMDPDIRAGGERRIAEIENTQRARFLEATEGRIAELGYRVFRGEATRAEIEAAKQKGLFAFREGAYFQLLKQLDVAERAQKEEEEQQRRKLAEREQKLAEQRAEDTMAVFRSPTQSNADKAFAAAHPELTKPDAPVEEVYAKGVDFARVTGFVPGPLRRHVDVGEIASDPTALAAAAGIADRLAQDLPGVKMPGGERVALVRELGREMFGGNYLLAAQEVLKRQVDPAKIEAVRDEFRAKAKEAKPEDVKALLVERFGVDEPPAELMSTFRREQERLYMQTRDMTMATKGALARLSDMGWGKTRVGGVERVTKFPVENFVNLPGFGPGHPEAVKLVEREMDKLFQRLGFVPKVPEGFENVPAYRIEADDITEREFREGRRPTFAVYVLNPYGVYDRLVGPDLQEVRYVPPDGNDILTDPALKEEYDKIYGPLLRRMRAKSTSELDVAPTGGGTPSLFFGAP